MIRLLLLLVSVLSISISYGQDVEIALNNPSFEDLPHRGGGPYDLGIRGWYDCGSKLLFRNETPPDIHPINAWQVTKQPADGRTYLGMVVRDNDTWELLSQRMASNIEEGKCYTFDIELSRSEFYVSGSKVTEQLENYTKPAVLRIWGGNGICGKQELLGESVTVSNDEWRTYEFEFRPNKSVNYFTLEAFYKVPTLFPYNGHLLLDNASLIKEVPCDNENIPAKESDELIVDAPPRAKIPVKTAPTPVSEPIVQEDIANAPPIQEPESETKTVNEPIPGLDAEKFRKDQIIRVKTIYFDYDSSSFTQTSIDALDQLYEFMKKNKNLVIEVGGHTNTMLPPRKANELSSARAKAVASHIVRKGISAKRVYYKGYGKEKAIYNNDKEKKELRKFNQRVELKILSTDYKPVK